MQWYGGCCFFGMDVIFSLVSYFWCFFCVFFCRMFVIKVNTIPLLVQCKGTGVVFFFCMYVIFNFCSCSCVPLVLFCIFVLVRACACGRTAYAIPLLVSLCAYQIISFLKIPYRQTVAKDYHAPKYAARWCAFGLWVGLTELWAHRYLYSQFILQALFYAHTPTQNKHNIFKEHTVHTDTSHIACWLWAGPVDWHTIYTYLYNINMW